MANDMGSLDGFLNFNKGSGGGGGGRLGSWKKNQDKDHGEITTWMHVKFMPAPIYVHPYYKVVESKEDKKLLVFSRRWTCHEMGFTVQTRKGPVSSASLQKWRNDDGTSEHKPHVCPECILTNVIARMVDEKQIGFTDVVFEWKGTDETVQILAGGIYGHFRKKKGLLRDHEVAMRKAKIARDEAYKHDMRNGLKYLFVVADNDNLDKGLITAIEAEGLGNKIRAAILAEGTKVQALTRTNMLDERVRGQWDPSITPYPFLWQYDNTKDFDDKFNVVALRGTEISDEIRALIIDSDLPEIPDLQPGNCFELRVELEEHCKINLPWDEIFAPAERAGLMKPPAESKDEVDEEEERPARAPEIRGAASKQDATNDEPVRIGPDHAAWKSKAFKPGAEFKGREVHVEPPGGATDADVERVLGAFEKVARVVAEVVACAHCDGEMTTLDPSCPTCGAEYDDDGKLTSRPCANEGCDAQVPLEQGPDANAPGVAPKYICPKCATLHEVDGDGAWKAVPSEPVPAASPRRRRRGGDGAPF